jgi:hypothetical protein
MEDNIYATQTDEIEDDGIPIEPFAIASQVEVMNTVNSVRQKREMGSIIAISSSMVSRTGSGRENIAHVIRQSTEEVEALAWRKRESDITINKVVYTTVEPHTISLK